MISFVLNLIKALLIPLPVLLVCLAGRNKNLPKPERSKQFLMPIVALVYVVVMMLFMHPINSALTFFFQSIPKWIAMLGRISWMPEFLSTISLKISGFLSNVLQALNLNFWVFYIANILIMLIYYVVKSIAIRVMNDTITSGSQFHMFVAEKFYEYFPEKGKWCVREDYVQARKLLKVFYYSAMAISFLIMAASPKYYFDKLLRTVFYPVFGIIMVGELYFYLDGATKREYVKDILGEDEDSYKIVNYSLLRKFLRSLFQDKLLSENTSINNALMYGVTNDEVIGELEKSEDPKVATFASYVKALNAKGFKLDHNYLKSSLDLLNGKSILFNNPFYNDLIPYAFYPMNRKLLSHKKVLVILGRHAIEDDIAKWLEKGIESVTNIPFMWKIGVLNSEEQELDIGIITRSDVLNMELHNANSQFLSEVGYVVIMEPSKLISTAQIGLNLIVKQCRQDENNEVVYCLCDKNCDGLIDAMSHILMTSLTEVSATQKHLGTSSYMCWEADDEYLHHRLIPNISRYLGFGTELSFAALKNQVSKAKWYGGESFPVKDIHWIDKQYYYELMKYAGLPTSQDAMDQHFETSSNFWSAGIEDNNYFTVEDESFNMFEILRNFATRSREQGFINVISTDYLLKDYMADNASIFETDAKAIPYIVADYARTNRNTILRLVLMMSNFPVSEEVLKKELSLIGIKVYSLTEQLWYELYRCYTNTAELQTLPDSYREAVRAVSTKQLVIGEFAADISLFRIKDSFNVQSGEIEKTYFIKEKEFLNACVTELKSAGYVAEDEKGEKYYIGSELSGHIYQKYLPGQFFTFGGKYYEMLYLTADNQVLIRRAADHINGRPTYRQIREYTISGIIESDKIGAKQNISGMRVTKAYADIRVVTPGYYQMKRYNDFKTAKKISFEGEKNQIPARSYCNKEILKIEFTDAEGKFSDNVRYTIATLMNEIFKTLFAENQPYICALTEDEFVDKENTICPMTYSIKAENCELSKNTIYIVEDSQLDLGLIIAVERNLDRILQIVHDYLDWHSQVMDESLNPPPDPVPPIEFEEEEDEEDDTAAKEQEKKPGWFARFLAWLKSLFAREKKSNFPRLGVANSEEEEEFIRKAYHLRYYTLFGEDDEPVNFDLFAALDYLTAIGPSQNALKQAREGKKIAEYMEATFQPAKAGARYCDFCGAQIFGVEYETLSDGRDRCMNCGRTAIRTEEEFRRIFENVKRNMEASFGIKFTAAVHVEMVNSQTLHKRLGKAFIPTPKADGRILGVAISDRNGYTLLVENGSPRMASMLTMAHELTHIWQYTHWDDKAIRKKYGKELFLQVYEGMAKWVEIQYAYLINEPGVAKREEIITSYRDDAYGHGFLRYHANYPFSLGTVITRPTPFMNLQTPLDFQYCGSIKRPGVPQSGEDGSTEGTTEETGKQPTLKKKPTDGPIDRTPGEVYYYAYEKLSEPEKQAYHAILDGIRHFADSVENIPKGLTIDQIFRIIHYIGYDHPEIFWFQYGSTVNYHQSDSTAYKVNLNYPMTKQEAEKRQKKIDTALKYFLAKIDDSMSDFEVTLRIYENIIHLVDYDSIALDIQEKDQNFREKPDDLRSIYGVFVNRKAVCAGYAKATQYLMNRYGLQCTYILSDTHAWNLIKLEGEYYHLDTTWGDSSNTQIEKNYSSEVGYDCYCITTKEVEALENHKALEELSLPTCTATACNYYHRFGLFFDKYDLDRLKSITYDAVKKGKSKITIKCSNSSVLKEWIQKSIEEHEFRDVIQYINQKSKVKIEESYSYSYSDTKNTISYFFTKN